LKESFLASIKASARYLIAPAFSVTAKMEAGKEGRQEQEHQEEDEEDPQHGEHCSHFRLGNKYPRNILPELISVLGCIPNVSTSSM
jgi:hypothetical protein